MAPIASKLALGAGCYWGTEKFIVQDFQKLHSGCIKDTKVGFMSPDKDAKKNPSYRQVCSGTTGHVEVLHVELNDPALFEDLVRFFFTFHDPTTLNRQGNDHGTQYASAIFCADKEQEKIANKVKEELQQLVSGGKVTSYSEKTIATAIVPYTDFYSAHEEHQEYLTKNPLGYCNHRYRFRDWPEL